MDSETKGKVIKSMKWSSVDTLGTQCIQFVLSILIARQLTPADYGLIGMLSIFIAISATFVDSGFGSALIQKKDADNNDYSTAFYFNVGVAAVMYGILYFCAPLIADFYNQPLLTQVTRVYLVSLLISALYQVQSSRMSKSLDFKSKAIISISSLIISGGVGLSLAYSGYGVWTLVWQGIVSTAVSCIMFWVMDHWHPLLIFSKRSFKHLFGFGGKLLGSQLINTIYNNISTIVIGKAYNADDLGLFSRAKGFAQLPMSTVTSLVMKVNYPILAELQDDNERLLEAYKVILRAPLFLLFPILFGMSALAYPMIEVLLGSKWLGCVPMLVILCMGYVWSPLTSINLNLLYVKGRTDLVLKLEFIKKPIAFAMLLGAIPLGIYGMTAAIALYEFIAFSINCYYTKKILDYGFIQQMKEIMPIIGYSIVMAIIVLISIWFIPSALFKLTVGVLVGIISYYLMARVNRDSTLLSLSIRLASRFPILSFLDFSKRV